MATAEDDDVNVGEGSKVAEQDYSQIVSVLQSRLGDATAGTGDGASALRAGLEIAAEDVGMKRGGQCVTMKGFWELGEIAVGIESEERRCTHSCSGHDEPMNPALWGNLPSEVLTIVFAHLPLVAISSLKLLSKEWREIVLSADFRRVCNEAYPRNLCLITMISNNMFWVRVLDHLRQKWHTYQIRVPSPIEWNKFHGLPRMYAACEDHGLVCFVTEWNMGARRKKRPPTFYFTVVNPLTASHKDLPPLSPRTGMKLVRIHVDGTTKAFKVFALARRLVWSKEGAWRDAGVAKHEYNSHSGEWITNDGSDGFDPDRAGRLSYNFGNGRLFAQDIHVGVRMGRIFDILISKGRLFVLQFGLDDPSDGHKTADQSPLYYIEEFHWQTVNWVKVDSHRCDPFERPPRLIVLRMFLHACDGFLMVIMENVSCDNEQFRVHRAWLYDLSTRQWSTLDHLPVLPGRARTYDRNDCMIQPWDPPGGWSAGEICDNTYNISMMLETKWVT